MKNLNNIKYSIIITMIAFSLQAHSAISTKNYESYKKTNLEKKTTKHKKVKKANPTTFGLQEHPISQKNYINYQKDSLETKNNESKAKTTKNKKTNKTNSSNWIENIKQKILKK